MVQFGTYVLFCFILESGMMNMEVYSGCQLDSFCNLHPRILLLDVPLDAGSETPHTARFLFLADLPVLIVELKIHKPSSLLL